MLRNIKSLFIMKKVFLNIFDEQILQLIKYNKDLQKKLNISLYNYKIFCAGYIIYDLKGKGKEYNLDNKLVYEGDFKYGKRNGKGKEFDNDGKLIFEGEYLYGKKWNGIEKIYYSDNNIKFYGIYSNGKLNGKGYDISNNITYEIKNGKGDVKEYDEQGMLIFKGKYLNGKRIGKGLEYQNKKLIFEGEYFEGKKWEGIGYYEGRYIAYKLKEGKGTIRKYDEYENLIFECEYLNGKIRGKGREYNDNYILK